MSETKRIRYLLGLLSAAEREQIESEYFADDNAFQEMLTAEDDLIDAYDRGELTSEERRSFEQKFASSLTGRNRVKFARAFSNAVSTTAPVESKLPGSALNIFKPFHSRGFLRTAPIAAVLVFVLALAWLVLDRRRMSNELRELRAASAELSKRTDELQRRDDAERTRNAELVAQLTAQRPLPDKARHPGRGTTAIQRARHSPAQDAALGKGFERRRITELPLVTSDVATLLTLQTAVTPDGYVSGSRANESSVALEGVWADVPETYQSTTIRGTAKDPNGNVVSGATVRLIIPPGNFAITRSTDKDGAYVFNEIPPGTYSIEVNASGFKTTSVSGLTARVDNPTIMDVQLEVGEVSERVEVSAGAIAAINTSDASLGNSFEAKRITQLPLDVNDAVGLLSLQPTGTHTPSVTGGYVRQPKTALDGVAPTIRIPSFLRWIKFQLALETAAIHDGYSITLTTAGGRSVATVSWVEPLTPNKTVVDTPLILTTDLTVGDYVLLLTGKDRDGTLVEVARYWFTVIE